MMAYIYVPENDLPDEVYELWAMAGDKLGLIVRGIECSGEHAPIFATLLFDKLNEAASIMKAALEVGPNK